LPTLNTPLKVACLGKRRKAIFGSFYGVVDINTQRVCYMYLLVLAHTCVARITRMTCVRHNLSTLVYTQKCIVASLIEHNVK